MGQVGVIEVLAGPGANVRFADGAVEGFQYASFEVMDGDITELS